MAGMAGNLHKNYELYQEWLVYNAITATSL